MSHLAISIRNLTKTSFIYEDRKATLKSLFAGFFRQGKTKRYEVLDDISLDIMAGEFLGIIGRNGSGKSTLLKIIAGIYAADKGSKLEVNGKVVPFLELGVGFNAELSGRENIFLNGTILGMSRKHLSEKFADIVGFAELENFIDMPIKNYSSETILAYEADIIAKKKKNEDDFQRAKAERPQKIAEAKRKYTADSIVWIKEKAAADKKYNQELVGSLAQKLISGSNSKPVLDAPSEPYLNLPAEPYLEPVEHQKLFNKQLLTATYLKLEGYKNQPEAAVKITATLFGFENLEARVEKF